MHRQWRELYPWGGESHVYMELQSDDWDCAGFWYEKDGQFRFKIQHHGGDSTKTAPTIEDAYKQWEADITFSKNFWQEKINWTDSIRINGVHYKPGRHNKNVPSSCKGFGGRKHKIQMHNGTIIETDDLWCQGQIPPGMREQLPDNAEWIQA